MHKSNEMNLARLQNIPNLQQRGVTAMMFAAVEQLVIFQTDGRKGDLQECYACLSGNIHSSRGFVAFYLVMV